MEPSTNLPVRRWNVLAAFPVLSEAGAPPMQAIGLRLRNVVKASLPLSPERTMAAGRQPVST